MHNTDFETFNKKLRKHVKLLAAVTQHPYIRDIIKSCRLKPQALFDNTFQYKPLSLIDRWVDEFGNAIIINKTAIEIIPRSRDTMVSTDLFFGRSLEKTIADSRLLYIDEERKIVLCYGNDEYIRAFCEKEKISPLSLGMVALYRMLEHINAGTVKIYGSATVVPLQTKQDISSCLPDWIVTDING
jgi:hypothetical protein